MTKSVLWGKFSTSVSSEETDNVYDKTNSTQCNQSHMSLIYSSFISKSVPVSHNTVITFEVNRFMYPLFESCHELCEAHLTKDRRQILLQRLGVRNKSNSSFGLGYL